MKNFYMGIQVEEEGRWYAYGRIIHGYENIALIIKDTKGIKTATLFPTKKSMKETVKAWNQMFKQCGTYMFGEYYDSPF